MLQRYLPGQVVGELHRYFWAGCLAFLADFLVLYLCTAYLGINYLFSNVLSFSVGLLITYLFAIKWIFSYRKLERAQVEFALFALFGLIAMGCNELAIWLLVEVTGLHYLLAKIVAAGATFLLNFAMKKTFLFSRRAAGRAAS
jgi:putative flippase GtrA